VQEIEERKARGRVYAGTRGNPLEKMENEKADDERGFYSVKQSLKQLNAEGYEVSPDLLYDWNNKGKIEFKQIKGVKHLDDNGLDVIRKSLQRRRLMAYLMDIRGMEREAARKYLYRHLKKRESIETIRKIVTRAQHEP